MKKYQTSLALNNQSNFLFYDYETFGTHTSLDKPAQFASVRTDCDLNVIENSQCFYCFPPDDYLPEPNSILITKITPQYTLKYGTNEDEFAKKIYNIFMHPNTCIIGYNNINFDDEITRNIFYRNFLDPYEWSWKNNNSRWDLLNIMRACYLLRPKGIKWPKDNFNLPIFRLTDLTQKNNISHNHAHDAISDVYATIELAKLVKTKQPKLFNFFFKYRKKNQLYKLIQLNMFQPILYISSYFGNKRDNMSCILPYFWHDTNNNILIAIDLFKDVKKLINFFNNVDYNVDFKTLFDLGILLIYLNRCPILIPFQLIPIQDIEKLKLKNFCINKKINLIKSNKLLINRIKNILFKINIIPQNSNVDLQIYNGFFNLHDKQLIKKVHVTLPIYFNKIKLNFKDARLKELFFRYKARNFFYILNQNEKKIWIDYCFQIFNRSVLEVYIDRIEMLLKEFSCDIDKVKLLNKLLKYVFKKYKFLFYQKINLN